MSILHRAIKSIRKLTWLEALSIVAIIVVLTALLLPATKWAASGDRELPVQVIVFDATTGMPIADARVLVFRAPPLLSPEALVEFAGEYNTDTAAARLSLKNLRSGMTGPDGSAVVNCTFYTGSNYQSPTPKVRLQWVWVEARAEGYGTVAVPVRHESVPSKFVNEKIVEVQGKITVPIGLVALTHEPAKTSWE